MRSLLYRGLSLAVLGFVAFSPPLYANPANSLGAPPPLEVYSRLPNIEAINLTPDGNKIAFIKRANPDRVIYQYDLTTEKLSGIAAPKAKLKSMFWADNDRIIVISEHTVDLEYFYGDKNQYYTGSIVDISKKTAKSLYDDMEGFYSIVMGDFHRITVDGKNRVTASNTKIQGNGIKSLYSFDLNTGREKLVDESTDNILDWVIKPDGALVARSEFDSARKVWTLRFKQKNGWKSVYTQKEAIDFPDLMGLGRDGQSVLVYIGAGEKSGDYFEISPDGVFSEPLKIEGFNRSPIFHPATRVLVGFTSHSPDGVIYQFFDPIFKKLASKILKSMPDYPITYIKDFADDPRKMIVYGEGAGNPGAYHFIDYSTGKFETVGETRPDLPSEWLADKRKVTYKASDGLEINGFLTLPPGRDPKNLPLILLPHGGPQSYDDIGFDWMSQAIASRGYAVLQPNFRGSDGYGIEFVTKGYGEWGRKMQTDLSDGVRYLAKEGIIDPRRVCIFGWSYGGYAALAGASMDTGVYKCAASIAGVSNLKAIVNWESKEAGFDRKSSSVLYWKRFMGDESRWDEISPDLQASKVDIPVLLIHGKDDDVVPVEQSYRMRDALLKLKKPVEFVFLKAEDHSLSGEPARIEAISTVVNFLEKHNPPY